MSTTIDQTPTVRAALVRRLAAQGLSDAVIADVLGVSRRTAHRYRKQAGIPSGRSSRALPDHGTRARYERGCDCGHCKQANTIYQVTYRRLLASRRWAGDRRN